MPVPSAQTETLSRFNCINKTPNARCFRSGGLPPGGILNDSEWPRAHLLAMCIRVWYGHLFDGQWEWEVNYRGIPAKTYHRHLLFSFCWWMRCNSQLTFRYSLYTLQVYYYKYESLAALHQPNAACWFFCKFDASNCLTFLFINTCFWVAFNGFTWAQATTENLMDDKWIAVI